MKELSLITIFMVYVIIYMGTNSVSGYFWYVCSVRAWTPNLYEKYAKLYYMLATWNVLML